jgi:hypothetical protein
MGKAELKITTSDEKGTRIQGVVVRIYNESAWLPSIKNWKVISNNKGECIIQNFDFGDGDKINFQADYLSKDGVRYVGFHSDKIVGPTVIPITMVESLSEYSFSLVASKAGLEFLKNDGDGKIVLEAINELEIAINNNLPHASISLSTYILEGLIRIEAIKRGLWKDEYASKTYGDLVHINELKDLFEPGELQKIQAFNAFRIPAVHFKRVRTILAEAQVGAELISQLITRWFSTIVSKSKS